MGEQDKSGRIGREELDKLRRRSRQYLEIKRIVDGAQIDARDEFAGLEAEHALSRVSQIIHNENRESKGLVPVEKKEGLASEEVVDLVYGELAASGKVIKRFGVRFNLVDDSDWHRTSICEFAGNGVVIELANNVRVALAVGKPVTRAYLT